MCDGEEEKRPHVIGCRAIGVRVCHEYERGLRRLAVAPTGDTICHMYHSAPCSKKERKIHAVDRAVQTSSGSRADCWGCLDSRPSRTILPFNPNVSFCRHAGGTSLPSPRILPATDGMLPAGIFDVLSPRALGNTGHRSLCIHIGSRCPPRKNATCAANEYCREDCTAFRALPGPSYGAEILKGDLPVFIVSESNL
jgi:hypothetical protein